MSKTVASKGNSGKETQVLKTDDEEFASADSPPKNKFHLPVRNAADYRELPFNDLVWWGTTILSISVIVETLVVATATKMIVQTVANAFQFWVQAGSPNIF